MIKNATIYRIAPGFKPDLETMEQALQTQGFIVTSPTQEKSVGWVPPRGDAHGPLVEQSQAWRVLKFKIETRNVPGEAVRQKAQEAADKIEDETGRRPGKKETRTLREDALLALLPDAFPRQQAIWVFVNLDSGWLVIDSPSQGRIDEVVTGLVSTFSDLSMRLLQTALTPQTAMTNWLSAESDDDLPTDFFIGRECELKSGDEEKAVVRFSRHNLQSEQIRLHLTEGELQQPPGFKKTPTPTPPVATGAA